MRALRDFNMPKIVTEDVTAFLGLLGDLFPGLEVERERNFELEKVIRESTVQLGLQPEETFILKVGHSVKKKKILKRKWFRQHLFCGRQYSWKNSWQFVTLFLSLDVLELEKARWNFCFILHDKIQSLCNLDVKYGVLTFSTDSESSS